MHKNVHVHVNMQNKDKFYYDEISQNDDKDASEIKETRMEGE